MQKVFPDPTTYNYIYKVYHPAKFEPEFIEILETESNIWREYIPAMLKRIELYPNISYVFITSNKRFEVLAFFKEYPGLKEAYNVVEYSSEMFNVIETKQYPFSLVVTPSNKIIYQGSPMQTFKLQPQLHKMNIIAEQLMVSTLTEVTTVGEVDSMVLSRALSGITRGGKITSNSSAVGEQITMVNCGGFLMRSDSGFVRNECRSYSAQREEKQYNKKGQLVEDIVITSEPIVEKLRELGERNSSYLLNSALENKSQEELFHRLLNLKNEGPNVQQIRLSDEQINPELRVQRILMANDENDELAQGRKDLREIEKNQKRFKIAL